MFQLDLLSFTDLTVVERLSQRTNVLLESCSAEERWIILYQCSLFILSSQCFERWFGDWLAGTQQEGKKSIYSIGQWYSFQWWKIFTREMTAGTGRSLDAADPQRTDSLASHRSRRHYLFGSLNPVRHETRDSHLNLSVCLHRSKETTCTHFRERAYWQVVFPGAICSW